MYLMQSSSLSLSRDTIARPQMQRYKMDFDEQETIGVGGFGAVVKVSSSSSLPLYLILQAHGIDTRLKYVQS